MHGNEQQIDCPHLKLDYQGLREKEQYLHFWQQIKVFYFLCVSQHLAVLKLIFTFVRE